MMCYTCISGQHSQTTWQATSRISQLLLGFIWTFWEWSTDCQVQSVGLCEMVISSPQQWYGTTTHRCNTLLGQTVGSAAVLL